MDWLEELPDGYSVTFERSPVSSETCVRVMDGEGRTLQRNLPDILGRSIVPMQMVLKWPS
jgi:hypothetical protein